MDTNFCSSGFPARDLSGRDFARALFEPQRPQRSQSQCWWFAIVGAHAKPRSREGRVISLVAGWRAADGSPRVPRLAVCPARSRECGRQHGRELLRCERGRFIGMVLQVADLLCLSWFDLGGRGSCRAVVVG